MSLSSEKTALHCLSPVRHLAGCPDIPLARALHHRLSDFVRIGAVLLVTWTRLFQRNVRASVPLGMNRIRSECLFPEATANGLVAEDSEEHYRAVTSVTL